VPAGRDVVLKANTALRLMVRVAVIEVFATEVAVMVTLVAAGMLLGATYVTDVVVWLVRVPTPERLHVTPCLFLSLVTVAVIA
jgi:hypothetical protein